MRNSFDLYNPISLHVGKGKIAKVATLIPPCSKVLLTYGRVYIKRNGIVTPKYVRKILENRI